MVDQVRFLNKRFQNVIIGKKPEKEGKKIVPVKVVGFLSDDEDNILLRYYNVGGENENIVVFKESDYLLDCPQVGMLQVGERVVYLRRVPERQWKRGFTENVIRSEPLSNLESRELGYPIARINTKSAVSLIYNPKYLSMENGLSKLSAGKLLSFAISRKFAISLKWDAEFPVVYYKDWVIGWVDEGVICLPKQVHHIFEELSQYSECRRV